MPNQRPTPAQVSRRLLRRTPYFRAAITFTSVIAGGIAAAIDLAIALPALTPEQRGTPRQRSPEEERLIFDACVTTFGVAYSVAGRLYVWFRAVAEAKELRAWSRWHLMLLKLLGGCWLLDSGIAALREALFRPVLLVGIYLVIWAVTALWQAMRQRNHPPRNRVLSSSNASSRM